MVEKIGVGKMRRISVAFTTRELPPGWDELVNKLDELLGPLWTLELRYSGVEIHRYNDSAPGADKVEIFAWGGLPSPRPATRLVRDLFSPATQGGKRNREILEKMRTLARDVLIKEARADLVTRPEDFKGGILKLEGGTLRLILPL